MPVGLPGSAPSPTAVQYGNLVGGDAAYAGYDQGIDFTGAGPVFALADAVITRVQRGGSGWPGEGAVLNYKILSGPATGKYVYVAEDFAPRSDLRPGMIVRKGEKVGQATGSGKAPGIEVGWARPTGIPLADRPPPRPADQHTPQGLDFQHFVSGQGDGGVTGVISSAAGAVNSAARHVPGVAQVEGAAGAVSSAAGLVSKLTDPSYILRGLQVIAGGVLVLVGVMLLVRQVALAADLPDPATMIPKAVPVPVPV